MTNTMLKLGKFSFSIDTAAFQTMRHSWKFAWSAQARIGSTPSLQFTGQGEQSINLSGVIYPGTFGTVDQVQTMAAMGQEGKPFLLVAGTGDIMGYWVIKTVSETGKTFLNNGQPRRIDFSLSLSYYGENYQ